jgi:hypothetical protein
VWIALRVALLLILVTTLAAQAQSEPEAENGTVPPPEPLRLRLYEDNSTTQFLDLRGNGEGPGDMYLWNQNPLFDADTDEEVGSSSGFCINTVVLPDVYAAECSFTLTLADGSLYVAGTSYNDGILAIIGGTGAYIDAVGTLDQRLRENQGRYEYTITLGAEPPVLDDVELRLLEANIGTRVVDMGEVGNSPGDFYLKNQNPLFDADTGEEVGSNSGYCVVTDINDDGFAYECAFTLTLTDGSIYVAGTSYDAGDLPILGGTGIYAGATGILTEEFDADNNQFSYEIRFDDEPPLPPNVVRTPEDDPAAFWDAFSWEEMSLAEQALWGFLGWTQESWDGEALAPASEDQVWDELTDLERASAEKLGFDQAGWDAAVE